MRRLRFQCRVGILRFVLTPDQTLTVWNKMHEARVRSYYFADLTSRYAKRKRRITGLSFVLSSGAVATVVGELEPWIPTAMGLVVAFMTGYAVAVNLDQRVSLLAKLHMSWEHLSNEYERLRQHPNEPAAERTLEQLLRRAGELSGEASTEAPYEQKLVEKWEEFVYTPLKEEANAA